MKEAILAMQHLIDWIDEHAMENPGLIEMSKQIGYSPYYCSEQFHRVAGITIKEYMARRRLSMAALAIRDTNPIADAYCFGLWIFFPNRSDESFCECFWMYTGSISKKSYAHTDSMS